MKRETSNILADKTYRWCTFKPDDGRFIQPEHGNIYVIRLTNPAKTAIETDEEIVPLEDLKLGRWDGKTWTLVGPHPKYDFSPLSDKETLREGTKVTHFAEVDDEAIVNWYHRLDPINKYQHLELYADEDKEKDIYNALILAASCIAMVSGMNTDDDAKQKLKDAYGIICDLQATIDRGGVLENAMG